MTKPTVGRVLHYYPAKSDPGGIAPGGPLAAIVSWVWGDTCVNLCVIGSDGRTFARTSVPLAQDGEAMPDAGGYCVWPPHLKG